MFKFGTVKRTLTRQQLEKAPGSLLSSMALERGDEVYCLATVDSITVPKWAGCSEALFQVHVFDGVAVTCMLVIPKHLNVCAVAQVIISCYTGEEELVSLQTTEDLRRTLIDYARLPEELCHVGLRRIMKKQRVKDENMTLSRKLCQEVKLVRDRSHHVAGCSTLLPHYRMRKEPTPSFDQELARPISVSAP